MSIDWAIKLGASQIDIIILIMGLGWSVYSFHQHRETKKKLAKLEYQYNALNTAAFTMNDKLVDMGFRSVFKMGNSQGDRMLNWDTEPTVMDRVNGDRKQ